VDVKESGNLLYVIGDTKKELGGSEYFRLRGLDGVVVPKTNPDVLKTRMGDLLGSMQEGLIASCHDVSEGGLAVAVCEMLIGGDLGATIDIAGVNTKLRSDYKLFSESNTRWVVEVWQEEVSKFEAVMAGQPVIKIGEVVDAKRVDVCDGNRALVDLSLGELRGAWRGNIL
jgi:phosphoribosylformylglycinamidine synthase